MIDRLVLTLTGDSYRAVSDANCWARPTATDAGDSQGPPAIQLPVGSLSALSQSGQGLQHTSRHLDADPDLLELVGHRPRLGEADEVVLRRRGQGSGQGVRHTHDERPVALRVRQQFSGPG